MHDLFRRETLEAKDNAFLGTTVLRPPLTFAAWSGIAALLATAVAAFLVFGECTKRAHVVGITAPYVGPITLLSTAPGLVVERRVAEGQSIKAGGVLFALSAEQLADGGAGVSGSQTIALDQLRRRHARTDHSHSSGGAQPAARQASPKRDTHRPPGDAARAGERPCTA